jgi:hypothetical protein
MRIRAEILGDLARAMAAEHRAGQRATTAGMRRAAAGLQADWRGQVTGAGLGTRLARSVRAQVYPDRPSMNAAAMVWTRAPTIVEAFERGVTIRSRAGFWLAIPTDAAPKGRRGGRITPGEFERRTGQRLRFVYRRGQPSLLVAEGRVSGAGRYAVSRAKTGRGRASVVVFLLVPQVTIRRRLGLLAAALKRGDALPHEILRAWREGGFS